MQVDCLLAVVIAQSIASCSRLKMAVNLGTRVPPAVDHEGGLPIVVNYGCGLPPAIVHACRLLVQDFVPKNPPTIMANFIFACHMGVHVDFSSTKNITGYSPKLA